MPSVPSLEPDTFSAREGFTIVSGEQAARDLLGLAAYLNMTNNTNVYLAGPDISNLLTGAFFLNE